MRIEDVVRIIDVKRIEGQSEMSFVSPPL